MSYNDIISELYKLHDRLLKDDKIDQQQADEDALALYCLLVRVDSLPDPTAEQVEKLNDIYNKVYNRNYKAVKA